MSGSVPQVGSFDIVPTVGLKLPKTRADWQSLIHSVVLGAVPLLVILHIGTADTWQIWTAAGLALVDAALSWSNSPDATRRLIYAVGGVVQTVLVFFGLLKNYDVAAVVGAAMTYLNAVLAQLYTPTSTLKIVSSHRPVE